VRASPCSAWERSRGRNHQESTTTGPGHPAAIHQTVSMAAAPSVVRAASAATASASASLTRSLDSHGAPISAASALASVLLPAPPARASAVVLWPPRGPQFTTPPTPPTNLPCQAHDRPPPPALLFCEQPMPPPAPRPRGGHPAHAPPPPPTAAPPQPRRWDLP